MNVEAPFLTIAWKYSHYRYFWVLQVQIAPSISEPYRLAL